VIVILYINLRTLAHDINVRKAKTPAFSEA
jgi:hypothetical protein